MVNIVDGKEEVVFDVYKVNNNKNNKNKRKSMECDEEKL